MSLHVLQFSCSDRFHGIRRKTNPGGEQVVALKGYDAPTINKYLSKDVNHLGVVFMPEV